MIRKVVLAFALLATSLPAVMANVFPVDFISVSDQITIHRSYDLVNGAKTPSNGLIIETDKSVILIDTAWNPEETDQILQYVRKRIEKPIAACIITHFHVDRCGGISSIIANKIPVYMTEQTNKLLDNPSQGFPYTKLTLGNIVIDTTILDIEYFGRAHSPDNITVYYDKAKLLFGGCLVKAMDAKTIGNTSDADVSNWPKVIRMIKDRYRDVKLIIPGHGEPGGPELLDHTLALLE